MTSMSFFWGVGRRKTSTARVRLFPGTTGFTVNGKTLKEYIHNPDWEMYASEPLKATETADKVSIVTRVDGGGLSGQAGALRMGVARALVACDPNLRPVLRKAGMLSRDDRMVERKKPGLKGARKRPQYSKR
ncbi:MAG: 30S ribosomal protein S9 [Candidatus Wallbacteria bacterium]|nr:30S ribosomal protein S9 [Candidatus Wallbacteria bacterium]MBI4869391.1 30S ribosomal protein S9 [Candidatus Wallbacteria bacterium]